MKKMKKFGVALAAIAITGTAGTALCFDSLQDNSVAAEAEAEANAVSLTDASADSETSVSGYLPDVKGITQKVMPSIVAITNESKETIQFWGREYEQDSESTGSGIIVAKSDEELLIATNNHVVDNADDLTVLFSVDADEEEDKLVSAQVKGTDSSLDLAVIAVKLEDIPDDILDKISVIEMGDSDSLTVGDWSIAIGNALGYGQSVTFGIISALDREVSLSTNNGVISNNMIQTDAAINFGNSGGALLDENGHLIGINSAKAAETGVEGMGYAIPINTAKPIIEDLMNQATRTKVSEEDAGALGIQVTNVSEEARQLYSIPAGAYVYELTKDGAAAEAGLKQGDIITKLDRTAISSTSELLNRMQYYAAGETVAVTVKRASEDGYQEKVIEVTLQAKTDLEDENSDTSDDDYEDSDDETETEEYYDEEDLMNPFENYSRPGRDAAGFGFFG